MCAAASRRCSTGNTPGSPRSCASFRTPTRARSSTDCAWCCSAFFLLPRCPGMAPDRRQRRRTAARQRTVGCRYLRGPAGRFAADVGGRGRISSSATALAPWRDRTALRGRSAPLALAIASVFVPLVAGAAPIVVLVSGFLVTAALGVPLAFTLALTSLTYLVGIGGVSLIILPIKILGGVDSFVLLAIPLFIVAGTLMEAGGISERIVDLRDGDRRQGARRASDGRGRGRDPVLGNLGIDHRRRVGDQLAARAIDAARRLHGKGIGQHRRRRVGDGHPGAAVPDDGGAGIAGEPLHRDAVPGRLHSRVRVGARAARPDCRPGAAPEMAGQPDRRHARRFWRGRRAGRPFRPGFRYCCSAASSAG